MVEHTAVCVLFWLTKTILNLLLTLHGPTTVRLILTNLQAKHKFEVKFFYRNILLPFSNKKCIASDTQHCVGHTENSLICQCTPY